MNTARNTDRIERVRGGGGELQREEERKRERENETVKKEIQVNRSVEQNNSQGSAQWGERGKGHQPAGHSRFLGPTGEIN